MTVYQFLIPAVAIAFGVVMALVAKQIAKNDNASEDRPSHGDGE